MRTAGFIAAAVIAAWLFLKLVTMAISLVFGFIWLAVLAVVVYFVIQLSRSALRRRFSPKQ